MSTAEIATAIGTWAVAGVTWWLVLETKRHLSRQNEITKDNLAAELQLKLEDKFDDPYMLRERTKLAKQIQAKAHHDDIQEPVMDFFESVGAMVRRGYLDKELAHCAFCHHCIHWWSITKDYVFDERKRQNNDHTMYDEFQNLVDVFYEIESKKRNLSRAQLEPSTLLITQFLEDESKLTEVSD
jgi:hypothetical protein